MQQGCHHYTIHNFTADFIHSANKLLHLLIDFFQQLRCEAPAIMTTSKLLEPVVFPRLRL